jgi:predicted ATPase/class 3 adenylate cyclase
MDFYEVLEQVIALLKKRSRASYRALQRQFALDKAYLEDLKVEIINVQQLAVDHDGEMLVWIGDSSTAPEPVSSSQPAHTSERPTAQHDQPIQAVSPTPASPLPDAARRQLTVMFADVVDSTQLSGQLDPEDYRDVLHAYQATCTEVVQRFDGHIAQRLGDALLVYFGFPHAHEDDAQCAVHTGLGILAAMQTLNQRLEQDRGMRLAIRVGIHTGLTVVSDVGAGQQHEVLALGEAPNIAARIQGLAAPDTIAMSAVTCRLVEGYFACEALGLQTLKGVAAPVQVYRVLGESGTRSRLDIAATRGLTPLVGREQEVGLLRDRWAHARDGQGQVVLLSGEGGIGKSRLVQVLKEYVAHAPHTRFECRSSPYYQHTALYPITDLLQSTLAWQAAETPEQRLAKLERQLRQYRLPVEESILLFAPLLSLPVPAERYPPLTLSPQRQRHKTLESLVAVLLELAERQPVLFILEDLHWTDPTTLEFVDLLLNQVPTASLLIVLTCRPTFQPPWGLRSHLTPIAVHRLTRAQSETMAAHVAGGKTLPREILQHIVERTDGVPLFIEEMTKAVLESGYLHDVEGQYTLRGPLPALAIPATLQDSLMARLDRLVTAKAVAQYAAVIGRQFAYQVLQVVSQLDDTMLQPELKRLVEAELLYQRGVPPQATYTFKHALIQDAAYHSLLKSTRQQYQQRIAQVLAERFPEVTEHQPELVAYHYTEAGLNEFAVEYWQQAGAQAVQRSANAEATVHLNTGLALLHMLPNTTARARQELEMQLALGAALAVTKGPASPEVESTYTKARELCQQLEDSPQLFAVLVGLRRCYVVRGELHTVRELEEQILPLAQHQHDSGALVEAHRGLGQTLFFLGEFPRVRSHLEQGIALYDVQRHRAHGAFQDPGVACLSYTAWVLWLLGYPDQALGRNAENLTLAQQVSHPYSLAYARTYAAILYQCRREWQETHQHAAAAVARSHEQDFAFWLGNSTMVRGWVLAMQGDVEEGITQIQQGLATRQATGASGRSWIAALLAEVYGKSRQPEAGLLTLTEALAMVEKTGECAYAAELHRLTGELLLHRSPDHATAAEACFQHALTVARRQHAKSWELRAAMSLARLWQSQGKCQDAYDLLAPIYAWFTEGFDTTDLIDAKALRAALGNGRSYTA